MMGVGGGGVMVPLMVVLGDVGQHMAHGTSLLAMIPASISGDSTHYKLGNVKLDIAREWAIGNANKKLSTLSEAILARRKACKKGIV